MLVERLAMSQADPAVNSFAEPEQVIFRLELFPLGALLARK